jgi:hypothetical protein
MVVHRRIYDPMWEERPRGAPPPSDDRARHARSVSRPRDSRRDRSPERFWKSSRPPPPSSSRSRTPTPTKSDSADDAGRAKTRARGSSYRADSFERVD